jgi:hypothetical protein
VKQASEHHNEQYGVGSEGGDEVKFGGVGVGQHTTFLRVPYRTDLGRGTDQSQRSWRRLISLFTRTIPDAKKRAYEISGPPEEEETQVTLDEECHVC